MKKSKHNGVLLKIMGLLLTAAALSLTGYNLWGEYQAERNADQALVQVAEAMPETEPEEESGARKRSLRARRWRFRNLFITRRWRCRKR